MVRSCVLSLVTVSLSLAAALHGRAGDFPTPVDTEKSASRPLDPDEVCRTATLPDGFRLQVFAAEPDVQNPMAITTDARGRLWVLENYTWAGSGLGGWDDSLRDRIVVLEDADGDGRHDRRTVFWDEGRRATSIEVGSSGVWVLDLPHLLFIPDADRDDVPDGPPEVVLDGLDTENVGHTPANGLRWGPDGWLYARHGIQGTSHIGRPGDSESQRVRINTGIWRYHPGRRVVEPVTMGMTNSWGFDVAPDGEMFCINTVIGHLWHVVPGSHVRRMYGTDLDPHVYDLIDQVADHVHWDTGEVWHDVRKELSDGTSRAGGGHAHIGLMIYQGDNWPEAYRGHVYTLNLHGRRINQDLLGRVGSGYTARHGEDLCFVADPWFRGMDLVTGPDGSVLIADWSDTGECHDHDGVHRRSGRIYKLVHGTPQPRTGIDLVALDDRALLDLLPHANAWWPRQAVRVLAERSAGRDPAATTPLRNEIVRRLGEQSAPAVRLHLLAALEAVSAADGWLHELTTSPVEAERVWAIRRLVEREGGPDAEVRSLLVALAEGDPSGLVRLHLAAALQRLGRAERWPLAEALCSDPRFAADRTLQLMVWYGIEPAVAADPNRAIDLLDGCGMPLVRRYVTRRLTERIEEEPQWTERIVARAAAAPADVRGDLLVGMAEALAGWSRAPLPAGWTACADAASADESDATREALRSLGLVFGDGRAAADLVAIATDAGAEPVARRQALRSLAASPTDDLQPMLRKLLADKALAVDAVQALAAFDADDTPDLLLGQSWYGPVERAAVVSALASRPAWASRLLAAVRAGRIAPDEISAFHARQIADFGDAALADELAAVWGVVRTSAADKRRQIDRMKGELGAEVLAAANPSRGRLTFQKQCGTCHVLYGVGRLVGPDLTGSNRRNVDYLLENVVDPSASVGAGFRTTVFQLDDGRTFNGVVTAESDRTVTIQTAQESVVLDKQRIAERVQTAQSLMPEGMLTTLSAAEIADLVAYLAGDGQVPLPE